MSDAPIGPAAPKPSRLPKRCGHVGAWLSFRPRKGAWHRFIAYRERWSSWLHSHRAPVNQGKAHEERTTFYNTDALALIALAANTATATEGVSPGALDRLAVVETRCPTFSWGAEYGAQAYEIVGYSLSEETDREVGLSSKNEVLFTRVTGSATAWTPSAEQCFAPGGRYVWFVRAVTELIDDQVIEAGEWSAGRYFSVPAGPSETDVARAIEVLKQWEAANRGGSLMLSSAAAAAAAAVPVPVPAAASATGSGSSHPKSVPTAAAAIRGEHPETDIEAYGVVGSSASVYGAGVAAVNTEGGPDLVLDGSVDGMPDTKISEWGIDRSDPGDQTFFVTNNGGGAITLDVAGTVRGTGLDCPSCVASADIVDGTIIDNDLADDSVIGSKIEHGSINTNHLQNGVVTSAKILDSSVSSADLADDAVTGAEIADGAVGAAQIGFEVVGETHLADDAVTHSKIAAGVVETVHLANNVITSSKIVDGTVSDRDLADESITAAKIEHGVVGSVHLETNAVTTGKILDGTILAADLADGSVGPTKIEHGGVQAAHIDAGVVGNGKLGPDAVTTDKIAPGAVQTADLHPDSVNHLKIVDGTIQEADLADGAVSGAKIAEGSITAAHIALIGGLYSSKSWLYLGLESEGLAPGGCTFLTAQCDDANDLPLQGLCVAAQSSSMEVRHEDAYYWNSTSEPAVYACEICYPEGMGILHATAKLICITVQ